MGDSGGEAPKRKRPKLGADDDDGGAGFSLETDLKISVEDETFEVHSVVLMLASPVFRQMLTTGMNEQRRKAISLPQKKEEFREFLAAIQPGSAPELTKEKALYLSEYADEYQVEGLKTRCEDFLIAHGPVDAASLRYAMKHNLTRLAGHCLGKLGEGLPKDRAVLIELGPEFPPDQMRLLWPHLCKAIGLVPRMQQMPEMPPIEHVRGMWPFVAGALNMAGRDHDLRADMLTWPEMLYNVLPSAGRADVRGREYLTGWVSNLHFKHSVNLHDRQRVT